MTEYRKIAHEPVDYIHGRETALVQMSSESYPTGSSFFFMRYPGLA